MNIVEMASIAVFILSSCFFAYLGWRSLKLWRDIKEEVIFHFMMIFFAVSLLILAFMISFSIIGPLPLTLDVKFLFIVGIGYDLFYLELSFVYLSLFPNTRRMIDKYVPLVIAGAILMNIIASSAQVEFYNLVGTALHVIVVCIGLFLLIRTAYKLKSSEKYFRKPEEIIFINYLVKAAVIALVLLVVDGIGFLAWHYLAGVNFVVTDILFAVFGAGTALFALISFYIVTMAGRKSRGCDLLSILNTIS